MSTQQTCSQILAAAGKVFAEKGFKEATVREICHQAGVNLAAVNYHFGDKERLYIAAVKHARRLLAEGIPMPIWPEGTRPELMLREFVSTMVRRLLRQDAAPWQVRLLSRELMEPTRACEEMVQESFQPVFDQLLRIVAQLAPPETTTQQLRWIGFSVIAQCVYYRVHDRFVRLLVPQDEIDSCLDMEGLARHITEYTLSALGRAGRADPDVLRRGAVTTTAASLGISTRKVEH